MTVKEFYKSVYIRDERYTRIRKIPRY